MLRRTERATVPCFEPGCRRLLKTAGTAGLALTLISPAIVADEPAPAAASRVPVKQATWTRSRQTSGLSVESTQQVGHNAVQTDVNPMPDASPLPASETDGALVSQPHHMQMISDGNSAMDYGFAERMQYAMTGGPVAESVESVGEWWQQRAQRMVEGKRSTPPLTQRLAQSTQNVAAKSKQVVESMTYDPGPAPETDHYEEKPIAITSSAFSEVPQTTDDIATMVSWQDEQRIGSKDRLKTDIRSIKPTLGYAMRNIDPKQLPEDFGGELNGGEYAPRSAPATVLQWAPTNLYHYPLYFEDPSLERYGHTYHPLVQPFASTGHFAVQFVGLPYQMALKPVHAREYDLGYYRPGECAPKKLYQIPFNEEATLVEIATIAGFILIIP
ncbi:MAG: hypothetical protein ACK58L_21550 [Planctomycetota bacterium]